MTDDKLAEDHSAVIARARAMYTSDDIEIDDNPAVSVVDEGAWVAAWVWVGSEEADNA